MKKERSEKTPREVSLAFLILTAVILFVIINTFVLSKTIGELERRAESTPLELSSFNELYNDFKSVRSYLSITVDHDDIAEIERDMCEIIGALSVEDTQSAAIAKSRLCGALGHLKQLSGFNIDSII